MNINIAINIIKWYIDWLTIMINIHILFGLLNNGDHKVIDFDGFLDLF